MRRWSIPIVGVLPPNALTANAGLVRMAPWTVGPRGWADPAPTDTGVGLVGSAAQGSCVR